MDARSPALGHGQFFGGPDHISVTNATVSYATPSEDVLLLWVGPTDSLQTGAYTLTVN